MNKIQSNAKKLDTVFKWVNRIVIFSIALFIAAFISIIFTRQYSSFAGTVSAFKIGHLNFELSDKVQQLQENSPALGILSIVSTIILLNTLYFFIKIIRNILNPIIAGAPFHENTGNELTKLGWLSLLSGFVVNIVDITMNAIIYTTYDFPIIFLNDNITSVTANHMFDLSFLFSTAVIFLLARIFKYGAELQQQVDETL